MGPTTRRSWKRRSNISSPETLYNNRLMATVLGRLGLTRDSLMTSLRTAVATVVSLLLARALKLPEFYWAPISTIVIVLSTIPPFGPRLATFRRNRNGRCAGSVARHLRAQ
jgi:uncharacterized membrane protein YccC